MSNIDYVGSELEMFADAANWKSYWAAQVAPFMGCRILDVGSGLGSNLETLYRPGSAWLCIEPDAELAEETGRTAARLGYADACTVIHGTLADVPAEEQADTIIYIDVLEHIEDHRAELERARRHLKPGGRIVVLAPAHQWLFSPFDQAVGHFRRYTRKSLAAVAPPGVRTERLRYLDSVGWFASAANRLVLRSSMPTKSQIAFWDRILVPPSRLVDKALMYRAGKSVLAIWQAV